VANTRKSTNTKLSVPLTATGRTDSNPSLLGSPKGTPDRSVTPSLKENDLPKADHGTALSQHLQEAVNSSSAPDILTGPNPPLSSKKKERLQVHDSFNTPNHRSSD